MFVKICIIKWLNKKALYLLSTVRWSENYILIEIKWFILKDIRVENCEKFEYL